MSVAVAERPSLPPQTGFADRPVLQPADTLPTTFLVTELPQEQLVQQRFKRLARQVGELALVSSQAELDQKIYQATAEGQSSSLKEAIHRAAWGDQQAREMIKTNVQCDVLERTIKAGAIIKIKMGRDSDGNIVQHGQSHADIHKNSLLFDAALPHMQKRSEAEARNSLRIENADRQGLLQDYWMVVLSRSPDRGEMTDQQAAKAGFFTDTRSMAVQATSAEGQEIVIESGFVAGVKAPNQPRHDQVAVEAVGNYFGVDYQGLSTDQIIDQPLMIHKSLMPNGVVDIVALLDQFSGGFFGQDKPVQDYQTFVQFCQQRQASYAPRVDKIVNQLISEAATIDTPLAATKRLNQLSGAAMVEYAIYSDTSINPMVFGAEAARHIEQGRTAVAQGDTVKAAASAKVAKKTEKSSSCPSANKLFDKEDSVDGKDSQETGKESKDGYLRCINCGKSVKKRDVVKPKSWCCPECHYEVDICNGKVLNKGNKGIEKKAQKPKINKLKQKEAPKKAEVAYNEVEELSRVA